MHDSLDFSEQHLQVRDMVRDFAEHVVKPSARRYDLESRFPWDNVKQMAELGLFGIPWPEELGGAGMDYLSYIIVIHELAKADASHAITVSAHTTLGTSPIVDFGTERSEEHTSELQSRLHLVCRLLLEKKKKKNNNAKSVKVIDSSGEETDNHLK